MNLVDSLVAAEILAAGWIFYFYEKEKEE